MKSNPENKKICFTRSRRTAIWAFQAQKHSKKDLLGLLEIDAPDYNPVLDNMSRFPGNTEPLRSNFAAKSISEKTYDEQGIFWAAHYRFVMQGQFYDIARLGFQLLQQNKFNVNQQTGVTR